MTTSTKSGLSNDAAVLLNVSSVKCQVGDQVCQSSRQSGAAIGGEPGAAALGVEIPLVPERLFRGGRGRPRRRDRVLNGIAADEHSGAHAIGMKRGGDARRASAPVVTRHGKPREAHRIGEVDEILADRRLLGHSRCGGLTKARRPVSTQVRHQHSMSRSGQRGRHLVPRAHIVGKTVEQDDGEARRIAALFEANAQHRCVDAPLDRSRTGVWACPRTEAAKPPVSAIADAIADDSRNVRRLIWSVASSHPGAGCRGIPAPTDRLDRSMSEPERVTLRSPPDDARPTFMQRGQTCKRRRPGAWSDKSPIRGSVKTTGNTETAGRVKNKPVYPLRSQRALC